MKRKIKCPTCRNLTTWDENPWRPFCSERCKMIDFGDWATERNAIPGKTVSQSLGGEDDDFSSHPYGKEN
jgi:uncharacterized protein